MKAETDVQPQRDYSSPRSVIKAYLYAQSHEWSELSAGLGHTAWSKLTWPKLTPTHSVNNATVIQKYKQRDDYQWKLTWTSRQRLTDNVIRAAGLEKTIRSQSELTIDWPRHTISDKVKIDQGARSRELRLAAIDEKCSRRSRPAGNLQKVIEIKSQ